MSRGRELEEPQAITFWHDDDDRLGEVVAAQRVDATDNNIGILETIVFGGEPDAGLSTSSNPGLWQGAWSA